MEERLIDLIAKFQKLSVKWSAHRLIYIGNGLAVPPEFEKEYEALLYLISTLGVVSDGNPNYALFDRVKAAVPSVRFYAGEKDSFGWLTGVCQINNLKFVW